MSESKSASVVFTNSSLLAKNAQVTADSAKTAAEVAQNQAITAQKTADGKNSVYRGSDPSTVPTAGLKAGDIYFTDNAVCTWTGTAWEKTVSDTTGSEINAKVEATMQESQKSVAGLKAEVESKVSEIDSDIQATQSGLATANSDLSNVKKDLSDTKTDLANTKTSLTASLDDTKKDIATTTNDLSSVKADLADTKNNLATTKTDLENTKTSLSTTVADLQKQTGQLSGSLETANSKIEYNSNAIAEVKHTADGISTTVSNIRVGGRNLLRNSDKLPYFGDNNSSWSTGQWRIAGMTNDTDDMKRTSKEITDPPQGDKATAISFTGIVRSNINDISLVAINSIPISGNVTVSFWARQTSNVDTAFVSAGWSGRRIANTNASTERWRTTQYRKLFLPKDGSWTRFWATFNVNNNENVYIGAGNTGTSAEVQICLVKIETGTMATDWTPAPEDTDQAISKVSQTADAIRADLTNTKGDVASVKQTADSLTTRMSNAEGNVSSLQQTANGLQSSVTNAQGEISNVKQTANKLQSDLSNAKGDISSLQQTASGLTSRVGNAEGNISQLQQTANGLTSTVSNMKSGGANMLPAGKLQSYYGSNVTYDLSSDTYTIVNPASVNARWGSGVSLPNAVIEIPWGQTACISMQVYSPTAGTIEVDINNSVSGVKGGNDNDNRNKAKFHNFDVKANTWQTVWFTYENSNESFNPNKASLWDAQTGIGLKLNNVTWKIRHPMVQIGTFPSEWSPSPKDTDSAISQIKQTANSLNTYVRGSKGSKTLGSILSMDPNNSTIAQVVNGHVVAAINTSSDGSVKIDGKALHITADTKIENAVIKSAMIDSIDASKITTGELDANKVTIKNLTADKIAAGTLNGMTIIGSKFIANTDNGNLFDKLWDKYQVVVKNTGVDITGSYTIGDEGAHVITSLIGGDLYVERMIGTVGSDSNQIKSIDINTDGPNPHIKLVNSGPNAGQYSSTYIGSDSITSSRMETNDAWAGNLRIVGHHIRPTDDKFVIISNHAGTNFDSNGSVGFQVYGGVGLGKNTIYTRSGDLYIQQGNATQDLGKSYSSANKTTIHAQKVVSKVANTVSSRLSVKTDITPVTYDRALAAVEGTEMYDYRYIDDDSGQHYVSGIIDDVNTDPQYHMDGMLINKERTARIDSNLLGYHQVVIQKLLERVAALEEKVK